MQTNLKSAIRHLFRNKLITSIKLIGLVLGLTLSVLLIQYAWFEFSYDNFHKNAADIYRLETVGFKGNEVVVGCATSDPAWGPVLKSEFPEVKDFVRIFVMKHDQVVKYNNIKFRENRVFTADPSFFRIFDYPLVKGDTGTVLRRPNTMVISESMAQKYFGNDDPVGKTMEISNGNKFDNHEITGVFRDFPVNSNLKYDFIISWETIRSSWPAIETFWNLEYYYTYVLLNSKASPNNIAQQSRNMFQKYSKSTEVSKAVRLVPLRDIHLNKVQQWEMEEKGNRTVTWVIVVLGFAILLIALINYVNIIISQSMEQSKSIGLRQLLGSGKGGIIGYFLHESVIVNLAGLVFSVLVISLASPLLTRISASFNPDLLFVSPSFWIIAGAAVISCIVVSGLLSGIAFSRLNPLPLLKGAHKTSAAGMFARKGFTVFQFIISIGFIIATLMVYRQMDFVLKKDLGVDMQQALALRTPVGKDFDAAKIRSFKSEVVKVPGVINIAVSSDIPGRPGSCGMAIKRNPSDTEIRIVNIMTCDNHYLPDYGIKIIAGQNFTEVPENNKTSVLLNEKAVALLDYTPEEIVGREVYNSELNNEPYKVIGVLKNFNQLSLREDYSPMMVLYDGFPWLATDFFSLKINTANTSQTIAGIEKEWQRFFPVSTLDYFFVDQFFNQQYKQDALFSKVLIVFSVLSVFISCLGVFALSFYITSRRTKEIGIRRVNGSTRFNILTLLSKDFTLWTAYAFVIASPLAFWGISRWLDNFPFRTGMVCWVYVFAGIFVFVIATLTVCWQAWQTVNKNPVEALRYE